MALQNVSRNPCLIAASQWWNENMIRLSGENMIRLSGENMIRLSGENMIRLSGAVRHIIKPALACASVDYLILISITCSADCQSADCMHTHLH